MLYKIVQPAACLRDFVKDYLLLHFEFGEHTQPPVKPFPANTHHCLVFYLQGWVGIIDQKTEGLKIFPRITVNGTITSRLDYNISQNLSLLSICFRAGALSKFLKLSFTEFVDGRIDAEAILNPEIRGVHEQMVNAVSDDSIIQIAEQYIWKRIQHLKTGLLPVDKVVGLVSESKAMVSIKEMADQACLSISQFERKFVQLTGVTPKFFARINRFYRAFQVKDKYPNADWLSIALEAGYCDYQHMVKDFKEFSGESPLSLLLAQAKSPERILGIG